MALNVGDRLAHYDVTALIGEGGMGQVYRARDTTLDRDVALKVLPDAFTADPDRLARFEREAKVLASLNHPNIGAIYGLEKSGDTRALVLELIEGPTLADRIKRGPIPLDEALPIAKQIAEALEAAHEAGVIHRDLKPANIKVRDDGTVKVLDFGLAKALDPTPEGDPSQSPTLTAAATQMGVIMGTAAYMSPEQARGSELDRRADIWSFGVVLYEMLTGKRLFTGSTVSDTLASVLKTDPDWNRLPADTPSAVRRLLRRCLERDRKERLQHVGDARVEIRDALDEPSTGPTVSATPRPEAWRRAMPWVAGLVVGLVLAGVGVWNIRPGSGDLALRKFTLPVDGPLTQFDSVSVSPDGQLVAYTRDQRLWIHDLDELEAVEVMDSDGASWVFWSPDSDLVGYIADGSVKKVSVQGGPSEVVGAAPRYSLGAAWGVDGTIIFAEEGFGISSVAAQGGEPRVVLAPTPERARLRYPGYLPDGQSFLFFALRGADSSGEIVVQTGDTTTHLLSVPSIAGLAYSPTGHILYTRGYPTSQGIWAVPFSLAALEVTGEPFLVAPNGAKPSVSRDGTLVYGVRASDTQRLVWVNRSGEVEGTIGQPQGQIWEPTLSPDGSQVAVQGQEQDSMNIWSHDVARGTKRRLTLDPGIMDDEPAWAPDGDQIAFTSRRLDGSLDIFTKRLDQGGSIEPLVTGPSNEHAPNWSRDGNYLAYHSVDSATGNRDMWYLDLSVEAEPVPFLQTDFDELVPQISPDSRHVAYQSNELGRWEVFVSRFPTGEDKQPVSINGGTHPRWSGQGDELFYLEGNAVMAVAVAGDQDLSIGQPTRLFSGEPIGLQLLPQSAPDYPNYNVDNEGQRFIAIQAAPSESGRESQIIVVQNWFEEFRPEN